VKTSVTNILLALGLIAIGMGIAAAGIYIGETDDAPGAALLGILLMIGTVTLGVRTTRRRAKQLFPLEALWHTSHFLPEPLEFPG
jgi:hypothetical protein